MKNTRKLLMAALMLVVAFAAVVSSTYAWFTLSNPLVVEDINVSVSESSGIYMAVKNKDNDTYTWRTSLTEAMLKAGKDSNFATKYAPVCMEVSNDAINFGSFKKLNTAGNGVEAAAAGTEYTTFTIYFKADKETVLDLTSILAAATGTDSSMAASSMLRVAVQGKGKEASALSEAKGWRKYDDKTSGIEVVSDATVGTTTYPSFYSATNPAYNAFVKSGALDASNTPPIDGNALLDGSTTTYKYAKIGLTGYTGYKSLHDALVSTNQNKYPAQIVTVPAYTTDADIVSITFTIWLEGWDSLATDALAGTQFSFNFTLGAHTAQ